MFGFCLVFYIFFFWSNGHARSLTGIWQTLCSVSAFFFKRRTCRARRLRRTRFSFIFISFFLPFLYFFCSFFFVVSRSSFSLICFVCFFFPRLPLPPFPSLPSDRWNRRMKPSRFYWFTFFSSSLTRKRSSILQLLDFFFVTKNPSILD